MCVTIGLALNSVATDLAALAEWPAFHGPYRDNMSRETGLLKQWPKDGPRLVWKYSGCGKGYSSVAISGGLIYTTGDFDNEEFLLALDLQGNLKWKSPNGKAWKGPQPGARTTPTCNDGLVYQLNAHGILSAFNAVSGKTTWSVDLKERFDATLRTWGYAENVIVEDNLLICTPGGEKARIAALDKKTGATIWVNTEIQDRAAYGSPLIVTHNGIRMFINFMHETVVGVDVKTGKLLWSHPHESTCDQNVTAPVYHEGSVFVTSGHRGGGRRIQLDSAGRQAREVWFDRNFDNCHGGVIYLAGHLYFCGCRMYNKGLISADWVTGKKNYKTAEIGKVGLTYAEGLLYCFGIEGDMMLVKPSPQSAEIISQFKVPRENEQHSLAHPVVCGGRLYVRHLNDLLVYDLRP